MVEVESRVYSENSTLPLIPQNDRLARPYRPYKDDCWMIAGTGDETGI